MPAKQLKETTMNPDTRTLIRVSLPDAMAALGLTAELAGENAGIKPDLDAVDDLVERLMGKNADARFQFIQANAEFVQDIDI
jgi:topoisomerase-4 subunit B